MESQASSSGKHKPEIAFAGKIKCWKIITDQCTDEPEILCKNFSNTGKNTDDQLYNINDEMYLVDLPGYGYAKGIRAGKDSVGKTDRTLSAYVKTA